MAKTNPIGVRFDKDLLEKINKITGIKHTHQKAHSLYEAAFKKTLDEKKEAHKEQLTDEAAKYVIVVPDPTIQALFIQPKTLDDIKAMCPPELIGIEKSAWIAEQRTKYKI
jgi:hypothetical protein